MEEYLAALVERDRREQAQRHVIDQYTRIADRLAKEKPFEGASLSKAPAEVSSDTANTADSSSLRNALVAAQQARQALETQIADLPSLQQEIASQSQTIQHLDKEITTLRRRLKDRNEELREGRKLVEQVQDEMVSLSLQLNMAEQKSEKLQAENKELVARWMKLKGQEADQMNEISKW